MARDEIGDARHHATVRIWRFICPECGFGDQEHDRLATVEEIYCEVCLSDDEPRRLVLRRWEAP